MTITDCHLLALPGCRPAQLSTKHQFMFLLLLIAARAQNSAVGADFRGHRQTNARFSFRHSRVRPRAPFCRCAGKILAMNESRPVASAMRYSAHTVASRQ